MSEYDHLITTICNPTAGVDSRSAAERRLLELLSVPNNLAQCLPSLYSANDTVVFFLGIGLQRLIWRYWSHLDNSQKESLLETVKATLLNRHDLQSFSKAKLEQVLAAICVCSSSLQPVFSTIVQVDHPGFLTGLSAVKTVLENVLGDDPKVDAIAKNGFVVEAAAILSPLTNLACTACVSAMQHSTPEQNIRAMSIGLDLLKAIVSKLQIGVHISLDVLDLLFSIAETGAVSSSPFHDSALSAMEILTEVMYKRYIPTGAAAPSLSSSSSNSSTIVQSVAGTKNDQGVKVLMRLVAKTIDLLKRFREIGSMEDSPIVLSLLEFIAVFGESHMERCMNAAFSHVHITSMDTDVAHLQETTMSFFNELVAMTSASMDPKLLHKLVQVWRRLVTITHVKESILSQQSVCVSIVSHLLSASLIQSNPHLQENMEEMLESLHVDVYVDTHMKEIMQKISPLLLNSSISSNGGSSSSGGNKKQVTNAEEHNYIGCALLEDVQELLLELLESKFACQWLHATLPGLLTANMSLVLSEPCPSLLYTRATLDLRLLFRMLPLIATNLDPILQLLTFHVQMMERHVDRGDMFKESILLLMTGAQIIGQFLQGHRFSREIELTVMFFTKQSHTHNNQDNGSNHQTERNTTAEWANHMESIFGALSRILQTFFSGVYTSLRVSADLQALLTSMVILYVQSVHALTPMLEIDGLKRWKDMVDENLSMFLSPNNAMQIQAQCPVVYEEVSALFLCAKDQLTPSSMSTMCVSQFHEATQMLENIVLAHQQSSAQPQPQDISSLLDPSMMEAVYHLVASLDVLASNHHILKPQKRQQIVVTLTPIAGILARFIHSLLYIQQYAWVEFLRVKFQRPNNTSASPSFLALNRSRSTSQDTTAVLSPGNNNSSNSNVNNNNNVELQQMGRLMEKINRIMRLSVAVTSVLLQRIGKKTFGKASSDILELTVAFLEACTTPSPASSQFMTANILSSSQSMILPLPVQAIMNINPHNALVIALFDYSSTNNNTFACEGLKLIMEILELSQLVAKSTAASSPTVSSQIQATHRLLTAILPYLSDERVCAELLPSTLKAGIIAVNSYWQKAPRSSLPFLPSIATANGFFPNQNNNNTVQSDLLNNSNNSNSSNVTSGINVRALTIVLVTLCIGSLGDSVPPSDTLIALEGLLSLREQHDVFHITWFQEELWNGLFPRILRCLLLRIHAMHAAELESLFVHLTDTRIRYLQESNNSNNNNGTTANDFKSFAGVSTDNSVPNNNGSNGTTAALQQFCFQIGNEIVTLAGELDCGDIAHDYLATTLSAFMQQQEQQGSACSSTSNGQLILQQIIRPVIALIFRRV